MNDYNAVDLFSGCGGLSEGMHAAGFRVKAAVEIDNYSVQAYKLNHVNTDVIQKDIRFTSPNEISDILRGKCLHLLAACPPCQGFSTIRRLNRDECVEDTRNNLVLEFLRFVLALQPYTIMMENVPGLLNYDLFKIVVEELEDNNYNPKVKIINVKRYGVPQSRRRLVLVGSRLGDIEVAEETDEKVTVREMIAGLGSTEESTDPLHKIYAKHTKRIYDMISLLPKNGGSREDLPDQYKLPCHRKDNIGFKDVYGRLRWDDYSTTITGGCLNPSKGRFLHPEENRSISAREAALLQTFPKEYIFPTNIPKNALALMIGNALPPRFSYVQCNNIKKHLDQHLD